LCEFACAKLLIKFVSQSAFAVTGLIYHTFTRWDKDYIDLDQVMKCMIT
jgi:hypothetical protein